MGEVSKEKIQDAISEEKKRKIVNVNLHRIGSFSFVKITGQNLFFIY